MSTFALEEIAWLTQQYGGDWGINHSRRLLHLIELIGEGMEYDREIVATAAYLHDWGAYAPWAQPGVDHVARSVEVAQEYLFSQGKLDAEIKVVLECIATHHSGGNDRPLEARLLSDADALDFLGVVGILRDFSKKPKAMREAYETIKKRRAALPGQLCLGRSRQIATDRVAEMDNFLCRFEEESFGCF